MYLTTINEEPVTFKKQNNKLILCLHGRSSSEHDTEQLLERESLPSEVRKAIIQAKKFFSVTYV